MTYTMPFEDLNKSDIPVAGGKGANLGELTAAGFPVPPGFVLTTVAYVALVEANGLQGQIVELANTVSPDDPQSSEVASASIMHLFAAASIPDDIVMAVVAAANALGDSPVAVRSSATAEDLPTASFAGQQDTYLNIKGEDALLDAVKKCWASLWTARALSYRLRQGIDPASVSLAVIVQQMAPADAAGILFTVNPVNGRRDQVLINATWGLGEAIVGGQVTPDTVVVDKSTDEIVSRDTASKTVMTVETVSGTEEQPVPQAQQRQSVLDDEIAIRLAHYGVQIEDHYGMPMDIEWAIAGDAITILQARPITSLPEAKAALLADVIWEPVVPNTIWMRRQIVEHMPQPLSPLFEDLYLNQGMDQSVDYVLDVMGEMAGVHIDLDDFMPHGFTGTINGYAYTTASYDMTGSNLIAILRIYKHVFRMLKMSAFDWDGVVLPAYQDLIAKWKAVDLAETTDEELLRGISEMATADIGYWFGSAVSLGLSRVMDTVFDLLLKSPLIRYALPEPRPVSASFLRGFDSKALDAQADLEAIAQLIRESAELRELVLETKADRRLDVLADTPDGQPALDGITHYLDKYGHQIYNLDFVDPTQTEDPLPMLFSLKALVDKAPDVDARTRQARMAAEREALVAQTMQKLIPPSRQLFGWFWKWTKHYAPYRESVMFYLGAAWPTLRKLAAELGQRLTDAGTLADPNDVYYLNSDEIETTLKARARGEAVPEFVELAQERRLLREARMQLSPPDTVPERGKLKLGPIDLSIFNPTPSDTGNDGPVLEGYAVSTGRVTAPASVIRSMEEFAQMKPGTVLVCTTTTPAWTPLFSQAVGLVTDIGGALAHGSIVAREYGIPAVMGTGVATERIKQGMMLAVDGDAGTVTLIDELDPQEEAKRQAQQAAERKTTRWRKAAVACAAVAFVGVIWWKRKR